MIPVKSLKDFNVTGRRVLVRVDYNVPMEKGAVTDDTRVRASLPTLKVLLDKKARVVLISHLGRPKGQVNAKYSLAPVAQHLSQILKQPVHFASDCVGPAADKVVAALKDGEVALMENLRFHAEEEKNDPVFAQQLARLGEFFVQDAFGAVHRAHASTVAVTKLLPSAAGLLLERELAFLGQIREHPSKPFMALVGGAKVSDKIEVLDKLLDKVDTLAIGGAMAYTFMTAMGVPTGGSLVEKDKTDLAKALMAKAKAKNVNLILPKDHLVVKGIDDVASARNTAGQDIAPGEIGVDIGSGSLEKLMAPIAQAKTIFWNGPMGIFEVDRYARGTREVAKLSAAAAQRGATVIIGGGDSVAAIQATGLADKITHISTGGGASLEFLEGKDLPGVTVLQR